MGPSARVVAVALCGRHRRQRVWLGTLHSGQGRQAGATDKRSTSPPSSIARDAGPDRAGPAARQPVQPLQCAAHTSAGLGGRTRRSHRRARSSAGKDRRARASTSAAQLALCSTLTSRPRRARYLAGRAHCGWGSVLRGVTLGGRMGTVASRVQHTQPPCRRRHQNYMHTPGA